MNMRSDEYLRKNRDKLSSCSPARAPRRELFLAIAAAVFAALLLVSIGGIVNAGEIIVKGDGTLTSIKHDRTVIIDSGGYIVPYTCKVYNSDEKRIRLETLPVPTKVKFEYVYTSKGPVIRMIRDMGE